jgi:geranylgeranylglycerol-phosphate geranylgeranyltransferase
MVYGYFKLARPFNALGGCLAVLVSGYLAGPEVWWPVFMAMFPISFLSFAAYAWNDYIDLEIDRINKPARPIPSGQVSASGVVIFSIVCTTISLLLAAFINQAALFTVIGLNILIYLYSWKLKCTVLLGNITVAAIIASSVIIGGLAAGNIRPVLSLYVIVFIANLGREILKTMADYRGDLGYNCRTVSTAWGVRTAGQLVTIILGISALAATAVYFFENFNIIYLVVIILGIYPLYIYIAIIINNASAETLEYASRLMKYSFFVWLLALFLGNIRAV